jgi:pSer/pThr/pTyr-binding forkhead associated (FHA) protein
VAADTGDRASSATDACDRCGSALPEPPDLEALAGEVDALLAAEFKRPVSRTEWAGSPPDGFLHNLLPWWRGVRESRGIWQRGQALWAERVRDVDTGLCERCRGEESATVGLAVPGSRAGGDDVTRVTSPPPSIGASEESPTAAVPAPEIQSRAPTAATAAPASEDEHESRTIIAPALSFAPRGPRLVRIEGPVRGHQFGLARETTTIGRSIACQVPIEDQEVGYQHARIARQRERWLIEEVMGSGGTYVNDERVTQPRELRHGDVIRVGTARLRYESEDAGSERAVPPVR